MLTKFGIDYRLESCPYDYRFFSKNVLRDFSDVSSLTIVSMVCTGSTTTKLTHPCSSTSSEKTDTGSWECRTLKSSWTICKQRYTFCNQLNHSNVDQVDESSDVFQVLSMEYNEFAKGSRKTISEVDFARLLLRYTALNAEE